MEEEGARFADRKPQLPPDPVDLLMLPPDPVDPLTIPPTDRNHDCFLAIPWTARAVPPVAMTAAVVATDGRLTGASALPKNDVFGPASATSTHITYTRSVKRAAVRYPITHTA